MVKKVVVAAVVGYNTVLYVEILLVLVETFRNNRQQNLRFQAFLSFFLSSFKVII
jgi:hypothetical protein